MDCAAASLAESVLFGECIATLRPTTMPRPRHPADSNRHSANSPTKLRRFQLRSEGQALSSSFSASNRAIGAPDDVTGRATFEMDVSEGNAADATKPDIGAVAIESSFRLSWAR